MPRYNSKTQEIKAKRLTKAYIENKCNASAVARKEGITRQSMHRRLKKAPVIQTMLEAMNKAGCTDKCIAENTYRLFSAKKLHACDVFIREEDGKLKVNKNSNDFIEVDDNNAQVAAVKLACQVKGHLKDNGVKVDVTVINLTKEEAIERSNRLREILRVTG
jgi:hypothetical protein